MEKVFRALTLKRKFSHSSAVNLRYLRTNHQASFPLVVAQSGSFFRLKGFHPFLDIYLHTVAEDSGRPLFFSCLLIFLVEMISSFILCFFYNFPCGSVKDCWSTTSWLVIKLL